MTAIYRVILTLGFIVTRADTALPQADISTATLRGTIVDASDAVIASAAVSAISIERGLKRQVLSDALGNYQIPVLQPGQYELRVVAEGFQPQQINGLVLTIGQVVVADVQMRVGDVRTTVEVTADVPLIETQRSQQANTIGRRQIENLPLVDRDFTDLVFTQPGIVSTSAAQAQNTRIGSQRSSGISVGGGNGRSNYFTIDGGENEIGTGGLRVRNMSVDSVQEFQINRNAFAAEYGFTSGTAINVITRGGSNNLHGSGYVYYRSQKTSARNAFDLSGKKRFEQRIYPGLTLGGPIVKNKAFFFTSYEALKLDEARFKDYLSDASLLGITPAQETYLSALTGGPAANANTQRIANNLRTALTANAATRQFLQDAGGSHTFPTRTHNWTTRLDQQISARDYLTARFTLADENSTLVSPDNVESFGRGAMQLVRDYTTVGTWNRSIGSAVINQLRMQFVKDSAVTNPLSTGPTIGITGVINYGRSGTTPSFLRQKRYQFEDILSWNNGRHTFKGGFSYRPVKLQTSTELLGGGGFQFAGGLPVILAVPPADQAVSSREFPTTADASADRATGVPTRRAAGVSARIRQSTLRRHATESRDLRAGFLEDRSAFHAGCRRPLRSRRRAETAPDRQLRFAALRVCLGSERQWQDGGARWRRNVLFTGRHHDLRRLHASERSRRSSDSSNPDR
jgi:hypothetical protein